VRRWATVFPLGMYAACSFTVGQVTGVSGITSFGQVLTWVAFAATLVVLAGLFRHVRHALREQDARPRAQPDVLQSRGLARYAEASKRFQPRDR
jgi:hypothetical protein